MVKSYQVDLIESTSFFYFDLLNIEFDHDDSYRSAYIPTHFHPIDKGRYRYFSKKMFIIYQDIGYILLS